MSSLLSSVASTAGSAGSAIGSGLQSAGSSVLSGLESGAGAIADGASWLGNQAGSFGDWITTAKNWKGPVWSDGKGIDTPVQATTKEDVVKRIMEYEAKRKAEQERQRRIQSAYSLMQNGLSQMNNQPYNWRGY